MGRSSLYVFLGSPPPSLSFRQKVQYMLNASPAGIVWDLFQVAMSLVGCAVYVALTYNVDMPDSVDRVLAIIYLSDYALRWYAAANRLLYPLTPWAIVDALAIAPSLAAWSGVPSGSFAFIRFFRVFRALRSLRTFRSVRFTPDPAHKQLLVFVLTIFSMLFINASLMNLVEMEYWFALNDGSDLPNDIYMSWGNALYMSIVTLTTVGYGDICPRTALGKTLICVFILAAFILVPAQLNKLSDLMAMRPRHMKGYKPKKGSASRHILVMGNVDDTERLTEFLKELYHPDRQEREASTWQRALTIVSRTATASSRRLVRSTSSGSLRLVESGSASPKPEAAAAKAAAEAAAAEAAAAEAAAAAAAEAAASEEEASRGGRRVCVIMAPHEPSTEIKALMYHPHFEGLVRYVRGSAMSVSDLSRVSAERAEAIFLLANVAAAEPEEEDRANALRALNVRNMAPHARLFVHLLQARALRNMDSSDANDEAVCVDESMARLVGQSALTPGFSTLVFNLLRNGSGPSMEELDEEEAKSAPGGTGGGPTATAGVTGLSRRQRLMLKLTGAGANVEAKTVEVAAASAAAAAAAAVSEPKPSPDDGSSVDSSGFPAHAPHVPHAPAHTNWFAEYAAGVGLEVYTVPVPRCFHGAPFTAMAAEVYARFRGQVIVLGVQEPDARLTLSAQRARLIRLARRQRTGSILSSSSLHQLSAAASGLPVHGDILLNPGPEYRVSRRHRMYLLAEDGRIAEDVANAASYAPEPTGAAAKLTAMTVALGLTGGGGGASASRYRYHGGGGGGGSDSGTPTSSGDASSSLPTNGGSGADSPGFGSSRDHFAVSTGGGGGSGSGGDSSHNSEHQHLNIHRGAGSAYRGGDYIGFPPDYESRHWTWGQNARYHYALDKWFGDYTPCAPSSAVDAPARPATAAGPGTPVRASAVLSRDASSREGGGVLQASRSLSPAASRPQHTSPMAPHVSAALAAASASIASADAALGIARSPSSAATAAAQAQQPAPASPQQQPPQPLQQRQPSFHVQQYHAAIQRARSAEPPGSAGGGRFGGSPQFGFTGSPLAGPPPSQHLLLGGLGRSESQTSAADTIGDGGSVAGGGGGGSASGNSGASSRARELWAHMREHLLAKIDATGIGESVARQYGGRRGRMSVGEYWARQAAKKEAATAAAAASAAAAAAAADAHDGGAAAAAGGGTPRALHHQMSLLAGGSPMLRGRGSSLAHSSVGGAAASVAGRAQTPSMFGYGGPAAPGSQRERSADFGAAARASSSVALSSPGGVGGNRLTIRPPQASTASVSRSDAGGAYAASAAAAAAATGGVRRRRRMSTQMGIHVPTAAGRSRNLFSSELAEEEARRRRAAALRAQIVYDVRKPADGAPPPTGHVIVAATLRSFQGFLAPLRSAHLRGTPLHRRVVLLVPEYDDSPAVQGAVEDIVFYGGCSIVVGSLGNADDVARAGIEAAACLVILRDRVKGAPTAHGEDGEVLDSSAIFSYIALEHSLVRLRTQPSFYCVVELISSSNLDVLNAKRMSKMRLVRLAPHRRTGVVAPLPVPPSPAALAGRAPARTLTNSGKATAAAAMPGPGGLRRLPTFFSARVPAMSHLAGGGRGRSGSATPALADRGGSAADAATGLATESRRGISASGRSGSGSGGEARSIADVVGATSIGAGGAADPHADDDIRAAVSTKFGNLFLPFFAAGYGVPADTLTTALIQAFYDQDVVRFTEELLSPSPDKASRVIFEPVPREFHGRPFSDLFTELLARYGVVVMGLYRCRSALHAPLHYVVTGPAPDTVLFSTDADEDCMYVLSPTPTLFLPDEVSGARSRARIEMDEAAAAAAAAAAGGPSGTGLFQPGGAGGSDYGGSQRHVINRNAPPPSVAVAVKPPPPPPGSAAAGAPPVRASLVPHPVSTSAATASAGGGGALPAASGRRSAPLAAGATVRFSDADPHGGSESPAARPLRSAGGGSARAISVSVSEPASHADMQQP